MRDTPKATIGPTTIATCTGAISVLLIVTVLLFPVLTAGGPTRAGADAAMAHRQPLPTLAPELAPPAVEVEVSQPPPPTVDPELAPPATEIEASQPPLATVTQPSPEVIPSASPITSGDPTQSPSPSALDVGTGASPTPELTQTPDPSPEPVIFPPGSITVRIWTCRPGYDPFAIGANLAADCVTPARRALFTLTAPGQYGPRDDRTYTGTLTFDDLGPATYTLSHSPPFLTAWSIPLSCTTQTPIVTATAPVNALARTVSLVAISLPLAQNQAIVCDWYNVPSRRSAFPPQSNPSPGPVEPAP